MKKLQIISFILLPAMLLFSLSHMACNNEESNGSPIPPGNNRPPENPQHGDTWTIILGEEEIPMTLVYLQPGTFYMGAQPEEPEATDREYPRHQVTLTRGFWMSIHEVTQAQWRAVTGEYLFAEISHLGDNRPVETVPWQNIIDDFVSSINLNYENSPWRLPTEAEWEYAARAGNDNSPFWWGEDIDSVAYYAWYWNNSPWDEGTNEVGLKPPNPWGLYDIYGNVTEWCANHYYDYPSSPVTDPMGPDEGIYVVFRGGAWNLPAFECCSTLRGVQRDKNIHYAYAGFRLVYQE